MKLDEFAFVNQQLAAMLRDGIPLEGALKQLCTTMGRGGLRKELELLEADLAKGIPLPEALAARKLPEFYVQMLRVGVRSNDLPGMLTLLADYYRRSDVVWTRLKGLLVYPVIVLLVSLGLSVILALSLTHLSGVVPNICQDLLGGRELPVLTQFTFQMAHYGFWGPVVVLALLAIVVAALTTFPGLRHWASWRLPVFRDANVWRSAAALEVMIRGGCPLADALEFLRQLEADSPAGREVANWQARLTSGHGRFAEIAAQSRVFPPLFVWLVANGGEDLAAGFKRAAEIYQARASYRTELLLQAVLPVAILVLGCLIFSQILTLIHAVLGQFMPFVSCC